MRPIVISFFFFSVFVLCISCKEEEEPKSPLIGSWESNVFVDSLNYWVVETLNITSDSTFISETTVRATKEGNDLGYRNILIGEYTFNGINFDYSIEEGFRMSMFYTTIEPPFFVPKDKLRPFLVDFSEPNGPTELIFSEGQNQMEISYECPSFDGICPITKIYVKRN